MVNWFQSRTIREEGCGEAKLLCSWCPECGAAGQHQREKGEEPGVDARVMPHRPPATATSPLGVSQSH